MIWRVLVSVAGLSVIAAATHANVMHAGGYTSGDAPLIVAVAFLLTIGMGYVGVAVADGGRLMPAVLFLCILAGEVYWVGTNAQREFENRAAAAAPSLEAVTRHNAARTRLDEAEAAKTRADTAAASEAAKRDCLKNCAAILQGSQDKAQEEVTGARLALAAAPLPRELSPLAVKLRIEPWAWDLVMAVLRSLAVVGGSIAVGMAWHPKRKAPASPAQKFREPVPEPQILLRPANKREHVAKFLQTTIKPDPSGMVSLRPLYDRYLNWCETLLVDPLPAGELGSELRSIVDAIGLECRSCGKDVIVRGAAMLN
jgi:hypothetical protein